MAELVLSTERFGEVRVDDEKVITLPDGLLGFVSMTRAVLLPVDDDGLFFWMQSVDDPALAFLVLTPWPLFPDYAPELGEADQHALDLDDPADALVFCLLTSHDRPRRLTANLLGPVVVNQARRLGRQVVLEGDHPTQAELPAIDADTSS